MSGAFAEGSSAALAFSTIQQGLALVNAVTAVTGAWSSAPFPANLPAVAVTTASVVSLLASIGQSFSGGGSTSVSTSYDAFSAQAENIGAGSVLGDTSAQSESIKNSLSILEDLAKPEFRLISQMNDSLISIDKALSGVSANILQTGGFALGQGFSSSTSETLGLTTKLDNQVTSMINDNISALGFGNSQLGHLGAVLSGASGLMAATKFASSAMKKVFGGDSKTYQAMTDYGLAFNGQLISSATEAIKGSSYQTIGTAIHTKGGWFGSDSTSVYYNSIYSALEEETARQFSLILGNLYDTVVVAGDALDMTSTEVETELSDFYVNLEKVSLKDKTGEKIQEDLTAIFSKVGDDMAKDVFPLLTPFQQIGEGLFETMIRVASGMEEADYYISKLGQSFEDISYEEIVNKQGIVSLEALKQSIIEFDESVYGAGNGVVDMVGLINSSSEDLYDTYSSLSIIRDQLEFIGASTSALTSSMLLGADGIDSLSDTLNTYYDNFLTDEERLLYQTQAMRKEFEKLGLIFAFRC